MNSSVDLLRAVFALAFVLGLIWLLGYAIRRYGARWGLAAPLTSKADRRLKIIETLPVDARNRLVLIQRDQTQHLLLVNADSSQVIEQNIPFIPAVAASQGAESQ